MRTETDSFFGLQCCLTGSASWEFKEGINIRNRSTIVFIDVCFLERESKWTGGSAEKDESRK